MDTTSINRAAKTLALKMARAKGLRANEALNGRGVIIEGERAAVVGCSEPYSNLNHGYWKQQPTVEAWHDQVIAKHGHARVILVFLKSGRAFIARPDEIVAHVNARPDDLKPRVFEDKLPAAWRWA
jgi:hypothetical protein